jgi:hypothetical protein
VVLEALWREPRAEALSGERAEHSLGRLCRRRLRELARMHMHTFVGIESVLRDGDARRAACQERPEELAARGRSASVLVQDVVVAMHRVAGARNVRARNRIGCPLFHAALPIFPALHAQLFMPMLRAGVLCRREGIARVLEASG